MEELIRKVLNAPTSSKHKFTLWFTSHDDKKKYFQIFIHRRGEDGLSAGVEDMADSFVDAESMAAWLDNWISQIAEEAKHDNERAS